MPSSAESGQHPSARTVDGICHVGLTVADLDRALGFYCDLLGLELLARWPEADDTVRRLVGYRDADLQTALLRVPRTPVCLELNEYRRPRAMPVDAATANPGSGHLALYVSDLDAVLDVLRGAGVRLVGEVVEIGGGPLAGGRTVYVIDPDGHRIELVEAAAWLDGSPRDAAAHDAGGGGGRVPSQPPPAAGV